MAVFNVINYGAVADGNGNDASPVGTNNYTAFVACQAAAAAAKGAVYVPGGVYRCSSRLTLTKYVDFIGDGPGDGATDGSDGASWIWGAVSAGGDQTVEGIKMGARSGDFKVAANAKRMFFNHCRFRGGVASWTPTITLGVANVSSGSIETLHFTDCAIESPLGAATGQDCIRLYESVGTTTVSDWKDVVFTRCHLGAYNGDRTGSPGAIIEALARNDDGDGTCLRGYDIVFRDNYIEASDYLGCDFESSGDTSSAGLDEPYGRVLFTGNLVKGGGMSHSLAYGVTLEMPVGAIITDNTFYCCYDSGLYIHGYGLNKGHGITVANNTFDWYRTAATEPKSGDGSMLKLGYEASGVTIEGNSFRVNNDILTTPLTFVVSAYGSSSGYMKDVSIINNRVDDQSSAGTGPAFLRPSYVDGMFVSGNTINSKGGAANHGAVIFNEHASTIKNLKLRNNDWRVLMGTDTTAANISHRPFKLESGNTYITEDRIMHYNNVDAAGSGSVLAATTQPTAYSKTAATDTYLSTVNRYQTSLKCTATGTVAAGDVLKDSAKGEWVLVTSIASAPTYIVQRGFAQTKPTTHAASATWTLVAQNVTAGITQPDCPRVLRWNGGQAGQTAKAGVIGKGAWGQDVQEFVAENGTADVNGLHAFRTVDSVVVPVRANASDTVAVGKHSTLGLRSPVYLTTDVELVERKATAATAYTTEAAGTVSTDYQTITIASLVDHDSFKIHANCIE